MASNLLLMVYGRCRNSDVRHVHEIIHDHSKENGFIEITTRHRKGAKNAQKKATLMPILMDSNGICADGWLEHWIRNRKEAKLPVSGILDGALLPAPFFGQKLDWNTRPLRTEETTDILRSLLQCDDSQLSSHSLKATALSWAAKAGVDRETRKNLGRHASAVEGSDGFYSRDLCVEPVRALSRVFRLIREDLFRPDNDRSNYFALEQAQGLNLLPSTPTFLGVRVPQTPAHVEPRAPTSVNLWEPQLEPNNVRSEHVAVNAPGTLSESSCIVVDSSSEASSGDTQSTEGRSTSQDDDALVTKQPPRATVAVTSSWPVYSVWIRNRSTKVFHRFESLSEPTGDSIHNRVTVCGRKVLDRFDRCGDPARFDSTCKICVKNA